MNKYENPNQINHNTMRREIRLFLIYYGIDHFHEFVELNGSLFNAN